MWVLEKLKKMGLTKQAFSGILVAGIIAMLIGSVLIIVAYVVINAVSSGVMTSASLGGAYCSGGGGNLGYCLGNGTLNASYYSTLTVVLQALGICGIGLIIVGIAMIVYVLMGLGVGAGGRR